jgi:hypothetical protein
MSLKGGHIMRSFDLTPFYRSTVGFDRLFNLLDQTADSAPGYPPYNIERTGENDYRVTVAVAGFAENELNIELKENTLTVKGEKQTKSEQKSGEVLYQGIAARSRTVSCMSIWCARFPRPRSRGRSPSMAARRSRARPSRPGRPPDATALNAPEEGSAPDNRGAFYLRRAPPQANVRYAARASSCR